MCIRDSVKGTDADYLDALRFLSTCLAKSYREKVIILIDEYDLSLIHIFFGNVLSGTVIMALLYGLLSQIAIIWPGFLHAYFDVFSGAIPVSYTHLEEKENFILFDYQNRSRLTHQAAVTEVETQ